MSVWGQQRGRMTGFDLPGRCQELPELKTTNVCLSLIYANEPVVISYPPSLPPPQFTCLICPAWLGRNLFQRSCSSRLMHSLILHTGNQGSQQRNVSYADAFYEQQGVADQKYYAPLPPHVSVTCSACWRPSLLGE